MPVLDLQAQQEFALRVEWPGVANLRVFGGTEAAPDLARWSLAASSSESFADLFATELLEWVMQGSSMNY